jgi:DNA-binding transcriptional LysR family regulator
VNSLDGIDVFVKVVQAGSFSAAARVMGMPVTTVSGKVASLERRLGVTLIQRTTRRLKVTDAGNAYFRHCVLALEEMTAGEKEILAGRSEPEGLLRITAPADLGRSLLPGIVRSYLKTYPKTKVELLLTDRIVDLVGEGVDLALRVGRLKDSSLIARKFRSGDVFLWASPNYIAKRGLPRHPKELINHAVIAHRAFGSSLKCVNGRQFLAAQFSPRIIIDDFEALKIFTISGDGIGPLSPLICEAEAASRKIIRVLPEWSVQIESGQVAIHFVYPSQRYVSQKTHAFIELALAGSL